MKIKICQNASSKQENQKNYEIKNDHFKNKNDFSEKRKKCKLSLKTEIHKKNLVLLTKSLSNKKIGIAGRKKCSMCSEFVFEKRMPTHLERHKILPLWSCKSCSFSTLIQAKFKFHQKTNCGEDDFKCDNSKCSFKTKNFTFYYQHLKVSFKIKTLKI